MRKNGGQCFPYLDDSFIFGFNEEECLHTTVQLVNLFTDLGFKVHPEKSVLKPTQKLEFLGFFIDSVNMTVSLPTPKIHNVLDMCSLALGSNEMTIRFVLHIIGTLNSYCVAVDYRANHFKNLECDQIRALKFSKGDFDKVMTLSLPAKDDLRWWLRNVDRAICKIKTKNPDFEFTSDASSIGWGAFMGDRKVQSEWADHQKELHINVKELLAVKLGLECVASDKYDCTIKINSDNTTTVSHINNMGGVRSDKCRKVAFELWQWCEHRRIWLYACHLPGVYNEIADSLSRHFSSAVEWELSQEIFRQIVVSFGQPTVDLFANRHNAKVNKYCCLIVDAYCWKTDAFSFTWTDEYFYIFPPFRLVGRCWRKMMLEGTKAILVAPDWPNQPWFASVGNTAKESIHFKARITNLSSPNMHLSNNNFRPVPLTAYRF